MLTAKGSALRRGQQGDHGGGGRTVRKTTSIIYKSCVPKEESDEKEREKG